MVVPLAGGVSSRFSVPVFSDMSADVVETALRDIVTQHEAALAAATAAIAQQQKHSAHLSSDNNAFAQRLRAQEEDVTAAWSANTAALRHLLHPFRPVLSLPDKAQARTSEEEEAEGGAGGEEDQNAAQAYSNSGLFFAQLLRDWGQGAPRNSVYDTILALLEKHVAPSASVLVPGTGLSRLAMEIALTGRAVEALDSSTAMIAASHTLLTTIGRGSQEDASLPPLRFHPFLTTTSNLRVARARLTEFTVAERPAWAADAPPRLTLRHGRFGGSGSGSASPVLFDAIVTCFFIDTQRNVLETVDHIHRRLKNSGVWINIGPLGFHFPDGVHLAADDLRVYVTEVAGFRVIATDAEILRHQEHPAQYAPFIDAQTALALHHFAPDVLVAVKTSATEL